MLRWLLSSVLLSGALAGAVCGQELSTLGSFMNAQPALIRGLVYEKDPKGDPLFHFKRVSTQDGDTLRVLRAFTYPDGRLAAQEHLVYEKNELVSFELDETQTGGHGSAKIEVVGGRKVIQFQYSKSRDSGSVKKRTEGFSARTLAGDMLMPFLAENWTELAQGKTVKCRFLVIPRLETIGFAFSKQKEVTIDGKPATVMKMEPSNLFLSALVDPLLFTLENASPHRVLQYVGRTTPKVRDGEKWSDLDAFTVFQWDK